jgi:Beta-galactosidase jelly roll domain
MNVAGLYGADNGWDLPGYPDRDWQPVTLPDSWAARGIPPGIGWYRTSFSLSLPRRSYVPVDVQVGGPGPGAGTADYRAFIYLNGWLIGRYVNNVGPQHQFYLPAGILNDHGRNTLAIAVWGLNADGGGLGQVRLVAMGDQAGGVPVRQVAGPGYAPAVYGPPSPPQPTLAAISSAVPGRPGQPGHGAARQVRVADLHRDRAGFGPGPGHRQPARRRQLPAGRGGENTTERSPGAGPVRQPGRDLQQHRHHRRLRSRSVAGLHRLRRDRHQLLGPGPGGRRADPRRLLAANNSPESGTGTIYYTDGSTQSFTLDEGNFWYPEDQDGNPVNLQVAGVDYANYPTGSSGSRGVPLRAVGAAAGGPDRRGGGAAAARQRGRLQPGSAHLRDGDRLAGDRLAGDRLAGDRLTGGWLDPASG